MSLLFKKLSEAGIGNTNRSGKTHTEEQREKNLNITTNYSKSTSYRFRRKYNELL
jgi:hypothetical protein